MRKKKTDVLPFWGKVSRQRWWIEVVAFSSDIFNFGLYFTENRLFWARPWICRHCESYLGCCTYFGMNGKSRPFAIIPWYQLHVSGVFFFKFMGVVKKTNKQTNKQKIFPKEFFNDLTQIRRSWVHKHYWNKIWTIYSGAILGSNHFSAPH